MNLALGHWTAAESVSCMAKGSNADDVFCPFGTYDRDLIQVIPSRVVISKSLRLGRVRLS